MSIAHIASVTAEKVLRRGVKNVAFVLLSVGQHQQGHSESYTTSPQSEHLKGRFKGTFPSVTDWEKIWIQKEMRERPDVFKAFFGPIAELELL